MVLFVLRRSTVRSVVLLSGVVMARSVRDEEGRSSADEVTLHDLEMVVQALTGRGAGADAIEFGSDRGAAESAGQSDVLDKRRRRRTQR
jgi:hypothetical protein